MGIQFDLRCSRKMPNNSVSERLNFPNNSQIQIGLALLLNSLSILLLPTAVEPKRNHSRYSSCPSFISVVAANDTWSIFLLMHLAFCLGNIPRAQSCQKPQCGDRYFLLKPRRWKEIASSSLENLRTRGENSPVKSSDPVMRHTAVL